MAGRAKENLPGGSLKYLFVYLKIRIFKCSYRMYIYIYYIELSKLAGEGQLNRLQPKWVVHISLAAMPS